MATTTAPANASIGELLRELSDGTVQLVRQEIKLARTETMESVAGLKHAATWFGIAAALGLCALGTTIAFLVLVLARYALDGRTWLAALIVAVVLGVVALLALRRGASAVAATHVAPRETAASIKETTAWLKHPAR